MIGVEAHERVGMRIPALASTVLIAGRCWHCRGLLVRERFNDRPGESGRLDLEGVRCIQCREIFDPLISAHRSQRARSQSQHRYYGR